MFDLFGNKAKRDMQAGYRQANERLGAGRQGFRDEISQGYGNARNRLMPYEQRYQQGDNAYRSLLGLEGGDAARSAYSQYIENSPLASAHSNSLLRRMNADNKLANAGGNYYSGTRYLANARAAQEAQQAFQNDVLNRLMGYGGQAYGVASDMAGLDTTEAGLLGDNERSYWQGMAGNALAQAQANAANRNVGLNNLLNIAGTVARFIPGAGGGGGRMGGVGGS